MRNHFKIHLVFLLAIMNITLPTKATASSNEYNQLLLERYCFCKTDPKASASKTGENRNAIYLDDPENKIPKCKEFLDEVISKSEVSNPYEEIKKAQKEKVLCDKKATNDWFKKYRELSKNQINKMEKEINEKICETEKDKKPNRIQKTCRKSLANLVIDAERNEFYQACDNETAATNTLNKSKQKRLENKCVKNKTYAKILYTFDSHYFKTACKESAFPGIEDCKAAIIKNAYPANIKSFEVCKSKDKFNTINAMGVCEEYVLSKLIGEATTEKEEHAMLLCLTKDRLENCMANWKVDEMKIAAQLKEMYCKAPDYNNESEKNACLAKLLASLEVPAEFNPEACKAINDPDLKKACLRKEYILSLVNGKDNKHFIVTDCWNKEKFPLTIDKNEPNWDEKPPIASGKQCDEASKKVFAELQKCENIQPPTITETDPETQQPVTKVNPEKVTCISKIEPKFLVNNYLEKLASANKAPPETCSSETDKTKCLVENSYSTSKDANLGIDGGQNCLSGDCNRSLVTTNTGSNNSNGSSNNMLNTLVAPIGGAAAVTGANALINHKDDNANIGDNNIDPNGNTNDQNGVVLNSNADGPTGSSAAGGGVPSDLKSAGQGSNWFSFFRDVKMMKKYKKATDKDCREIYHAAKTKVIGTVASTAMVVGAGIAAGSMISKEKKKPQEERNQKVYWKAAGLVTSAAAGAVLVNMAAVKSARTKLEKASISLATRAQQGPINCGIQGTAYIDLNQNYFSPIEYKSAIASIKNAKSPLEAYLNYQEWSSYLDNENTLSEVDQLLNHDFDEDNHSYHQETLKKMKGMFISLLDNTSSFIIPRAVASDEPKEDKTQEYMAMAQKLLPLAMTFMNQETGSDKEDKEEKTSVNNPVVDANAGVDDCETNQDNLDYEYGERKKQEGALTELEKKQTT